VERIREAHKFQAWSEMMMDGKDAEKENASVIC